MNVEIIEIPSSHSSTVSEESVMLPVFNLTVRGQPKSLPRVRFFHGGIFNSAKRHLLAMHLAALDALPGPQKPPLYPVGTAVDAKIFFYLKRPNSDFVGNRRAPGNLKPHAASNQIVPFGPDIDNLAKLVLDALNGIVYHDDKQVVKLELYKLRDNEMMCTGRTQVICTIHQNMLP